MDQVEILNNIFKKFNVSAVCHSIESGHSADIFNISLMGKTKVKHIESLLKEISLDLKLI